MGEGAGGPEMTHSCENVLQRLCHVKGLTYDRDQREPAKKTATTSLVLLRHGSGRYGVGKRHAGRRCVKVWEERDMRIGGRGGKEERE